MEEIKNDLKEIKNSIGEIKIDTIKNTLILEEHIRRTEASENRIEKIEDKYIEDKENSSKERIFYGGIITVIVALSEIIRRFI